MISISVFDLKTLTKNTKKPKILMITNTKESVLGVLNFFEPIQNLKNFLEKSKMERQ